MCHVEFLRNGEVQTKFSILSTQMLKVAHHNREKK